MNRISWHRLVTPLALAALLSLSAPGLAYAAATDTQPAKPAEQDPHHPDKAGKAADTTAQPAASADMMGDMMKGGMMGEMMKDGMMGRCNNPAVVINILPGGQMSMGHMKSMGMMGEGIGDGGMGMMGMKDMGDMSAMMPDTGGSGAKAERKDMSAKDVRNFVQSRLDKMPHGPAKVGDIAALDDNLFSVQLLDEMGEKMHRLVINRHTGKMMQAD